MIDDPTNPANRRQKAPAKAPGMSIDAILGIIMPAALDGCKRMRRGDVQTVNQICGSTAWNKLCKGDQLLAGRLFSYAVEAGDLPLVKVSPSSRNHQQYKLK